MGGEKGAGGRGMALASCHFVLACFEAVVAVIAKYLCNAFSRSNYCEVLV